MSEDTKDQGTKRAVQREAAQKASELPFMRPAQVLAATDDLYDYELDGISGGDVYCHNPRGSNNRQS